MKNKLILGLGNPIVGDEGVGVEVIQRIRDLNVPDDVDVVDGGTGGIKLIHILENRADVIIVDCADFGGLPGEIKIFGIENIVDKKNQMLSLHHLDLKATLDLAETIGIKPKITVIGVQPEILDYKMGLSKSVNDSIPKVIKIIFELL